MKEIYLISFPIKVSTERNWYLFHFTGYYQGMKIKEVAVYSSHLKLKKNRDYFLRLRVKSLKGTRLIAYLLEAKDIVDLSINF